jgi:hypothetical protein
MTAATRYSMSTMRNRLGSTLNLLLFVLVTLLLTFGWTTLRSWHRQRENPTFPSLPSAFADRMPVRVIWAWEEPEDLHTLPSTVGVAYLAETLLMGDQIVPMPRRQPLRPAPGSPIMAVVRLETRDGFTDTTALRSYVVERLVRIAKLDGVRALQIDFDATSSQRPFYKALLQTLRPQLPQGLPLSITALVSWCGPNSWLHGLPVDEAVPMLFRMGGPMKMNTSGSQVYRFAEPLCRTSVGLATDEGWPSSVVTSNSATRLYFFAPRSWTPSQLSAVASYPILSLAQELFK